MDIKDAMHTEQNLCSYKRLLRSLRYVQLLCTSSPVSL
jgi:hypothetical protein